MTNFEDVVPTSKAQALSLRMLAASLVDLEADRAASGSAGFYRNGLKRTLDITLLVLAAPFVLPLVGIFALIVMADGGSPFYVQERVGAGGRIFRMWKLRTMCLEAEERLTALLESDPELRSEWEHCQKLRHDPRVTRLGRILRKTSLDELPQLWNVMKGEMSLVGPRPMLPEQEDLYPGSAYYRLRPGLTGLWQVSERNKSSFADRARFDTAYDQSLSFATDARLIAATVKVVLRGTGC